MTQGGSLLTLDKVNMSFGETRALIDCNLRVEPGEFVTLLGPSGCGKTTTLRIIAGFLRPNSGEVRLDDAVLSSTSFHTPPEKRNMGMVFQSFAVWPHMSVFDNIALPLRIRGMKQPEIKERCAEIFRLCRLLKLEQRYPHELSGGQLQRIALARALVYRPRLLLLDEPLSNLDATLREDVRRELHAVHKAIGTTFILVTHDQVEAMSLSNRIVVMNHGRIEQIGTPQELYRAPKTEFVAKFVGAANLLEGVVAAVTDEVCQIKVARLDITAPRQDGLTPGAKCTVAIHPESVRLAPASEASSDRNSFRATVRDVYFLGRIQEIQIDIDGTELRVIEVRGNTFRTGEEVLATFPEHSVILL
jgi:ABC-type Fe3+/spermidine/putrescine transport system ATPase subunit